MNRLVIVGCGGFGREVHDIVDALISTGDTYEVVGYVDDSPSASNRALLAARGAEVLGPLGWFESADREIAYIIGIGNGPICRRIDRQLTDWGFEAATLVHPEATTGFDVRMRPGVVIAAGARLTTNISLGRHVHIDRNCVVGHDSRLHDYVVALPAAGVAGATTIGEATLLGTQSAVLQGLVVGSEVRLGAGAIATKDIPAGVTAVGVPARWRGEGQQE